jgi:hypothetical protein
MIFGLDGLRHHSALAGFAAFVFAAFTCWPQAPHEHGSAAVAAFPAPCAAGAPAVFASGDGARAPAAALVTARSVSAAACFLRAVRLAVVAPVAPRDPRAGRHCSAMPALGERARQCRRLRTTASPFALFARSPRSRFGFSLTRSRPPARSGPAHSSRLHFSSSSWLCPRLPRWFACSLITSVCATHTSVGKWPGGYSAARSAENSNSPLFLEGLFSA